MVNYQNKKNIYRIEETKLYFWPWHCLRSYSLTFEWFCPQTAPLWGPLRRAWRALSSGGGAAWTRCCILWGYMADLPCLLRLWGGEGICAVCQKNKGLTVKSKVWVANKEHKKIYWILGTHSPYKSVKSCTTAWMIKPEGHLFHQGYTNLRCFYTLVQT